MSAFHRLQPIFEKRKRHWSALLRSLPSWLAWALWVATAGLTPLLRYPLYKLMPHRAADEIALLLWVIALTAALVGVRHTTIVFRHSWDTSPLRQYVKEKLIPVIAGALLGIGGTILAQYLRHIWP